MNCTESLSAATLSGILNSLDVFVYATDPVDNKILFINEPMKKHYNIEDDIVGQHCYKVLQRGKEKRCDFCPCHKLEKNPECTVIWVDKSSFTNRIYRNTDRFVSDENGKKIHIHHSVDITNSLKHDKLMKAVNRAASLLLASENVNDIKEPLIAGMELIGRSINADRVHIWRNEMINDKMHYAYTYGWFGDENDPHKTVLNNIKIPVSQFPTWHNRFMHGEYVGGHVSALSEMEQNFFRIYGVKSIIILPLFLNNNFWGFFCVDNCIDERDFEQEEINILRSISLMMANAISQNTLTIKMNEAHERSMLMLDTSPICTQIWAKDLSTIDCNEAGVRLYGFKNKQDYIDRFLSSCSPEYQPDGQRSDVKAVALVHKAFEEGYCRFDWMHKMPDSDELIPADITLVRSKYRGEDVVIGYTTDMREYSELLMQRTEAEIASQTKSSFLASMSHEIRTPMNAILGVTEILIENPNAPEEIKEGLIKINNSGNLLLGIINDILDFSKIEAGKLDITPAPYSVAELIGDSANLNAMRIDDKPIIFEVLPDEKLPAKLLGDELRIKQILNNVLSNAFKYTDAGTVTFTVGAEPAADGILLVFGIQDTGIGMTDSQLKKLFEEYSRFEEGINRGVEGTGLGLAITRRLLKLMDGEIFVESEYGKGSTFTVKLPQKVADDSVIGSEVAENIRHFRMVQMGRKQKSQIIREPMPYGSVLIVDDLEPNLYVAEGLMKPYGLKIETVMSGYEAVNKIENGNTYDIIFMDHMMPGMDGVETTVTLRKMGYTEPIVALTANALAGQSDKFIQKGFDEFISKPIDTRQLNQILNKLIRDKQPQEVLDEARKKMNGEAIQAKTSSLIVDAMRSVKGIGVDAALAVLGGMLEVYENTIKLSARLMPITINKMDSCLTEENLKNFAIEVHGFKGVAKSIGAAEIAETANRLEIAALNNEKDFCKAHYPDFKTAVVELMTKMNEAINQEPVDKKEKINPEELTDKLTSAKQFAEEYDAMAALELLKPLLNYTFNEEAEALLEKAVFDLEEFNCVNAVEKLSGIIQLLV